MVGWHHQLNGYEFEQTPVDGEGQGRLACRPSGLMCHLRLVLIIDFLLFFFGQSTWHVEFPPQGLNPQPLHWQCRVLTTGMLGLSLIIDFLFGLSLH